MDSWFSQYNVPDKHICWNSYCDCEWRKRMSNAYKPNRQTLAENSNTQVSGYGFVTYCTPNGEITLSRDSLED